MKRYSGYIVVFILAIVIIAAIMSRNNNNNEIEKNKGVTICKFTYCYPSGKSSEARFRYYVNGVKYKNGYGNCPDYYNAKLKRFYVMYYSTLDPNKIQVDFTRQVTDTAAILDAGFSLEELSTDAIEKGDN